MPTRTNNRNTETSESTGPSAFEWTFLPILILAALSLIGAVGDGLMYYAWYLAAGWGAIRLIIAVVGSRIFAGMLLSIVVLAVSCGINLLTVEIYY